MSKYVSMPELKDVVELLVKSMPEDLSHINADRILYAGFSKPQSSIKARVGPIPARFSVFLEDYDYFLEVHIESWMVSDESRKLYVLLHELLHIPFEGFEPSSKHYKKTEKHDLEDFKILVKEYGVDMENAEKLQKIVEDAQ